LNYPTIAGAEAGTLEASHSETSVTSSESSVIPVEQAAPAPVPTELAAPLPPPPTEDSANNSVVEAPAEPATIEPASGITFASLGLSPELLHAVAEAGYTIPTPIQAEGIPHVLKRRDIIGIAQTGTGKTASFTLPMIELLARGRAKARMPRTLILEPTRELAAQVAESFEKYGKYNKLSMALLIGGVSFDDQNRKLDRGVDVLIATPGRLLDHFERGKLMLSQVQILVIDEADRMLDMGFIPDVERICKLIPFTRQTLFYSATMPTEIRRLTEQFLQNPVRVEVARPATTGANIKQEIVEVPSDEWAKREALRILIKEAGEITNAIVFCNKKRIVDVVAKSLQKHGFNAAPLHGDLDQSVRTKTLDGFRTGEVTILVASDVAARGLDIPATSHIFNFDVPYHPDDYVHRVGRTGRAGRSGEAYMLATQGDTKYIEAIERLTKTTIPRRKMEGLADQVRARPPREDRGGRDRHPRKGRGERHREHPVKPHGQVASMEPAQHVDAQPQIAQPQQSAPRPNRQPQQQSNRPPRQHQPKRPAPPQPQFNEPVQFAPEIKQEPRSARPQQNQQQQKPQRPAEPKHVDTNQLPAFLLRPINLPKAPEKAVRAPRKAKEKSES
jgi:superfamily II DNA/RNA helicase